MTIPRLDTPLSSFTLDDDRTDVRHQSDLILSILCDILEQDGADHLGKWFDHVGFDPTISTLRGLRLIHLVQWVI